MDMKTVPLQTTADLLRTFVLGGVQDTALGGAIAHELDERGMEASVFYNFVVGLIAKRAAAVDLARFGDEIDEQFEDDELDYCGGMDPDSWCGKGD